MHRCAWLVVLFLFLVASPAGAEPAVDIRHAPQQIEALWRGRIQSILDRGQIPLIDLLSFLPRENGDEVLGWTMRAMDELGVALIAFAGYWAPKPEHGRSRGYRWGYYIHEVMNAHPDRFILTTNKGGNRNWWRQKGGKRRHFIDQLESRVRGGNYRLIGQVEFRHYMSNAQCKAGKTHRDIDIPLDGENGHRVFVLAQETGIPLSIHVEPEDHALKALQKMLGAYPKANVIVSHFGQIRHPERERRFGPSLVGRLLKAYPNLHYDLSTGEPNRIYACGDGSFDTVIWQDGAFGRQQDALKPAYRELFTRFSNRFIAGFDYGPQNRQSEEYFHERIANIRLILRDLPKEAQHNIGYRNAWRLLIKRRW